MKIIFCGPPHSGKSVFLDNLIEKLPPDYVIVRGCPDGEGFWSNNKDQIQARAAVMKDSFSKEFIDTTCEIINNQSSEIVLVDVGGRISEENKQIFKCCDAFVILSSKENEENAQQNGCGKEDWLKFGEDLGLKCIAVLESSLVEKKDEIYSTEPYIQGHISGLDRGTNLVESAVIEGLSKYIIENSGYLNAKDNPGIIKKEENLPFGLKLPNMSMILKKSESEIVIDDTLLGLKLGYAKEAYSNANEYIANVTWRPDCIPTLYDKIPEVIQNGNTIKLYGVKANYVSSSLCKICKEQGIEDLQVYYTKKPAKDGKPEEGFYVPIKTFQKQEQITSALGLEYRIVETDKDVFFDVTTKGFYTLEQYEECVLPQIDENKNLYISGGMPLWLLDSIACSYDSNRIFTFQPGNGFICVNSNDEKDLGQHFDGIDGIDVNRYLNDKRQKKLGELSQYVDNSIKATLIQPKPDITKKVYQDLKDTIQEKNNKSISLD